MACHISFSERRAEAVKGRCDGSRKEHSSIRHRSHRADKTQGGKRQPKRERKTMERSRERVRGASLTVQVLFLGAHDLVGRGLAYCLRYRGASDTVLGRGDSVRQALARHLCGLSATPSAPQPAGPGAGLRAARRHPLGEPRLACSPRAPTPSRGAPGPRASASAHPFPGQLEPDRARGTGSCRKMAAPGSSSELSGLPLCHVTRVPPPALFLPPLLPSLSSPARPPPSLRRGKSGAAPARYVVEPARRAQQEARPRGRRGPPRHVTLPANRSPEARPRVS